ncbi:MAG TPA: hypothetical protein VKY73_03130 [Polyangiaceae bacterium]|nr:hypothetical protein [Polyangiaceae bacterium]
MKQHRAALVAALAPALAATACGDGHEELLFGSANEAASTSGASGTSGGSPNTEPAGGSSVELSGGTLGVSPSGGSSGMLANTGGTSSGAGPDTGGTGLVPGMPADPTGGDTSLSAGAGGAPEEGGAPGDEQPGGAGGVAGANGLGAAAGSAGETELPQGGTAGTAGAAGTAGTAGTVNGCATPGLLDDMEDGDDALCTHEGQSGTWFTTNDGSVNGVQEPPALSVVRPVEVTDRAGSTRAMRTTGRGFSNWGAALGFRLRSAAGGTYDASTHDALTFYAKGKLKGKLRVALRTRDLAPAEDGGTCAENTGMCRRYHGADIALTSGWHQYRIPFDLLVREGNGGPPFDPKSVVGVEFRVPVPAAIEPFEFWVDDVAFETVAP